MRNIITVTITKQSRRSNRDVLPSCHTHKSELSIEAEQFLSFDSKNHVLSPTSFRPATDLSHVHASLFRTLEHKRGHVLASYMGEKIH